MPPQFSPVQNAERIHLLDALRGFAILGIFIANLWGFTWYAMYTPEQKSAMVFGDFDPSMEFLQAMFVEGKFYSIFSMLFGIGFALYLKKKRCRQISPGNLPQETGHSFAYWTCTPADLVRRYRFILCPAWLCTDSFQKTSG